MFGLTGIGLAFIATFGWALGDFYIQKSTRIVGSYQTMFVIGAVGCVGLLPFIYSQIPRYSLHEYAMLGVLSLVILAYAVILFEALRTGKISVVESVVAFELPLTVFLGVGVGGEALTWVQTLLFLVVTGGILAAVTSRVEHLHYHKHLFEKGVLLAFIAAFLSALTNFYVGVFSQTMSPIVVIWATHTILALLCGIYMVVRGQWRPFARATRRRPWTLLATGLFDNAAWVGYAAATSLMPIAVVVTISEGYIALAALLGFVVAKERLARHQIIGAVVACTGVIVLSMFS